MSKDNNEIIYVSHTRYEKLIIIYLAIPIIIMNLMSFYLASYIGMIIIDILLVSPLFFILYFLFFKKNKPIKLYNDRLIGIFNKINVKTNKQEIINEIKFNDVSLIYFARKLFDNHIYIEYNNHYQTILGLSDKTLLNKIYEIFDRNHKNKIQNRMDSDETLLNVSVKYLIPLFTLAVIGAISFCILFFDNIQLLMLNMMILFIVFAILAQFISSYLTKRFPHRIKVGNT